MLLYRVDVRIAGTAYIKATNESEALRKLREFCKKDLMVQGAQISGDRFDDPDLPDVSLSPAMTLYDRWPGAVIEECS